jgi:hypothetical protein
MKVPFVGPFYQARSLNADSQRAVNCFLEMDNASPRAPVALYGTPGLTLRFTLPTGPVRGCIQDFGSTWWVGGNTVYRVLPDYTIQTIGTIGTSSGRVSMAFSGTQIIIVDGSAGYILTATAVLPITDGEFPNGVTRATFQDNYFAVAGDTSGRFYISDLADGRNWDGLDFASGEGSPDNTIGIISDHGELWLFGDNSAEPWTNTGNPDFPFQRATNAFIEAGTAAGDSICKLDNSLFWYGQDDRGAGIVWRMTGYTPVRVSNHAVEKAIQSYTTTSDAFAYSFQMEGHSFYVLTFPTEDATWVYDVATQQWFEWLWRDPNLNTLHRHRSNCHVSYGGEHLVGDWETGEVYALDFNSYTDNGDAIIRLRTAQTMEAEQKRLFYASLQVDMETGVGLAVGQGSAPLVMLRFSDDGGHTWSDIKTASVGAAGQYGGRAMFRRLGAGRNRTWELSMTDPVKFAVFGAVANVGKGSH